MLHDSGVSVMLLHWLQNEVQLLFNAMERNLHGAAKKDPPKGFWCFLSNSLEFLFKIVQLYLVKPFTSNCQVKSDFVEKQ